VKLSSYLLFLVEFILISCASNNKSNQIIPSQKLSAQIPYLTFQKENLFPGDGSLLRPEDGVALADGRAVFRMADLKSAPAIVADSFYLANGITMDRDEKTLFVPKLC
jgi:hypothetical protein